MIRIGRDLRGFEGRSGLKTWAFAIATRVVIDHLRAPEKRLGVVEIDETVEPPDGEAGLDDRLIASEMSACVRGVIDTLPADDRADGNVLRCAPGSSRGSTTTARMPSSRGKGRCGRGRETSA